MSLSPWMVASVIAVSACACSAPAIEGDDAPADDGVTVEQRPDGGTVMPEAGRSTTTDAATAARPDAGTDADTVPVGQRVFVTSTTVKGNLGGLAGADRVCGTLAAAAGLGGTWVAWLSSHDGEPQAIDRVTGTGPFRLVTGELVAASKSDLTGKPLAHAIDRDENGVAVPKSRVWTGSGANGRYLTKDCAKWTGGGNNGGRYGDSSATSAQWTDEGVEDCDRTLRLYCFER